MMRRKRSINPTRYMKDGEIRYSNRAPVPLVSSTRTTGQLGSVRKPKKYDFL